MVYNEKMSPYFPNDPDSYKNAFNKIDRPFIYKDNNIMGIDSGNGIIVGFEFSTNNNGFLVKTINGRREYNKSILKSRIDEYNFIGNSMAVSITSSNDMVTIFLACDSGFPVGTTTYVCGIFLCIGETIEGDKPTAIAGYWSPINTSERTYGGELFVVDSSYAQPGSSAISGQPIPLYYSVSTGTNYIQTSPILGRGNALSDKLGIITCTPEQTIGSIGRVNVGGKEYYKNGIFLIDPD